MLGSGCRRLMWERESSSVEKEATVSSNLPRVLTIADLRPSVLFHDTVDGIPDQMEGRKAANVARSS